MKKKIVVVASIGLLLAAGLVLVGCEGPGCIGNGECTITITQGTSGLYVDRSAPRSDCGKSATWNSDQGKYTGGCKVNNMNSTWYQTSSMRHGTHKCDC